MKIILFKNGFNYMFGSLVNYYKCLHKLKFKVEESLFFENFFSRKVKNFKKNQIRLN